MLDVGSPSELEEGKQMSNALERMLVPSPPHLQAMPAVDDIGSKVGVDGRIVDDCISTK